jgi:hypothetical protein
MTGVAGLRLFLIDKHGLHQREALQYLVTALGEESSSEVQEAIVAAFEDAKKFSQDSKDDALGTALEVDRSLTASAFNHLIVDSNAEIATLKETYAQINSGAPPTYI